MLVAWIMATLEIFMLLKSANSVKLYLESTQWCAFKPLAPLEVIDKEGIKG